MDLKKHNIIDLVFNVRPLWDKGHKEHHNRHILAKEWKKIGAELGMTGKFYLFIYFVLFSIKSRPRS